MKNKILMSIKKRSLNRDTLFLKYIYVPVWKKYFLIILAAFDL